MCVNIKNNANANQGWQTRRKSTMKKKQNIINGDNVADEDSGFKAAQTDRVRRIHVGNIKHSVTEADVRTYCTKNAVVVLAEEKLMSSRFVESNDNEETLPISMKFEVAYENEDQVMSPTFWPKGVHVRGRWPFKKSNHIGQVT